MIKILNLKIFFRKLRKLRMSSCVCIFKAFFYVTAMMWRPSLDDMAAKCVALMPAVGEGVEC